MCCEVEEIIENGHGGRSGIQEQRESGRAGDTGKLGSTSQPSRSPSLCPSAPELAPIHEQACSFSSPPSVCHTNKAALHHSIHREKQLGGSRVRLEVQELCTVSSLVFLCTERLQNVQQSHQNITAIVRKKQISLFLKSCFGIFR